MKKLIVFAISIVIALPVFAKEPVKRLSDQQVKRKIIQESIASYPGNCPCPYNSARNGSRCGGRSAWSRPGGYSPICYESDVTQKMIRSWRKQNRQ